MANNCYTTYKCIGPKEELDDLEKKMQAAEDESIHSIIVSLGEDPEPYQRRGIVLDYDRMGDTELDIYQDTAWREQEGFRQCIQKVYPNTKVYFQDEEPGCEWYVTNSFEYFPERYMLDSYEEPQYYETIDGAAEDVSEIVGYNVAPDVDAIYTALDKHMEEHPGDENWYSFHVFELITDEP